MKCWHGCVMGVLFVLPAVGMAAPVYIAPLDGSSAASTFEVGTTTSNTSSNLPQLGWTNVSGAARMFDGTNINGVIIHASDNDNNYEVQHTTATAIQPNSRYTLSLQMGFAGGNSSTAEATYRMQIGTVDQSSSFTPLGPSATGTVNYGNNMTGGSWMPAGASLVYDTAATVSGDLLAVRWAQTSSDGGAPWFGFDNVRLEVVPIPEPATAALLPPILLLARRRAHPSRAAAIN